MTEPNQDPPPLPVQPLAYQTPGTQWARPPGSITGRRAVLRFFVGFLLGAGVSALVWVVGWNTFMGKGSEGYAIYVVPGLKLVIGITLLFFRNWRSFAGGLITSIALGVLIFGVGMVYNCKGM